MRTFGRLIAVGLVLPLMALCGSLGASQLFDVEQVTAPPQQTQTVNAVGTGPGTAYQCCWVYHSGRWWCLPC